MCLSSVCVHPRAPPNRPSKPPLQTQVPYSFTAADYATLSEGVGTLAAGGWATSTQFVFGNAKAVAVSPSNNAALVSAAGYGPGRLLFLGSPSYFGACTGTAGICRLLANAARWAAAGKSSGIRLAAAGAGSSAWATSGAIASLVSQVGGRQLLDLCALPALPESNAAHTVCRPPQPSQTLAMPRWRQCPPLLLMSCSW